MAQDYNIWIRNKAEKEGDDQTKPQEIRESGSSNNTSLKVIKGIQNFSNNGFNGTINTAVSMVSKKVPWVATAAALISIAYQTVKVTAKNVETYTGDYRFNLALNNVSSLVGNISNPVNYAVYLTKRRLEFNRLNEQIDENRLLVGDSTLRNLGRGV